MATAVPQPPASPLAALEDIIAAPADGWWPPAPGWWLLALLCCTALLRAAPSLYQRWRRRQQRRVALCELTALYQRWRDDGNARNFSAGLSILLKRTLLGRAAPADMAALHGRHWQDYLSRHGFDADAADALASAPYRPAPPGADAETAERLYRAARRWLSASG